MKIRIEKEVVVITPTIGQSVLGKAIESVANQSYKNIKHLVVIDGPQYLENTLKNENHNGNLQITVAPENTGKTNGDYWGHRIYAAYPHLVNADYVFFLDEDNWYEPDHVSTLVETIEKNNLDWAHSLRKIYTPDKKYITDDNCESLGKWPIYFSHDNPQYLVDTSSFAFTRKFIQSTCHLWHSGAWGEDRRYFYAIANQSKWDTNGKHTLCYRVDGNPQSVSGDFFIDGNKKQLEHYKGVLPWLKT